MSKVKSQVHLFIIDDQNRILKNHPHSLNRLGNKSQHDNYGNMAPETPTKRNLISYSIDPIESHIRCSLHRYVGKERTDTTSKNQQKSIEIVSDVFGWSWIDPSSACEAQIRSWQMYEGFRYQLNYFCAKNNAHTHSHTGFNPSFRCLID